MEINGVPVHPLVVHAAVVFGPLGALAALAHVALPSWRARLRWPMVGLALLATGAIVAAYLTGTNFLASRPELRQLAAVQTHRARGTLLLWVTLGFAVVAVTVGGRREWAGWPGRLLHLLLAGAAVGVLVLVVLTGDAGARAVWAR